jgi:hypothetical protein
MRISNLLPAFCAAALLWGGVAAEAQDNPAQAAARAALMEKMRALNAQPNPPANPPGAIATPAPVQTQPPSAPAAPLTPAGANDTPAQAAARAALAGKMGELNAQPQPADSHLAPIVLSPSGAAAQQPAPSAKAAPAPVAPEPANAKPAPAAAVAPVSATASVPSVDKSGFSPVPPPSNPNVQTGAKPAGVSAPSSLKPSQVSQQPAAKPAAPAAAPAVKPAPATVSYPGKSLGFKPVEAPPPPVSAQKQTELQALLTKYMANQISPDEYQKERAAILAAP